MTIIRYSILDGLDIQIKPPNNRIRVKTKEIKIGMHDKHLYIAFVYDSVQNYPLTFCCLLPL